MEQRINEISIKELVRLKDQAKLAYTHAVERLSERTVSRNKLMDDAKKDDVFINVIKRGSGDVDIHASHAMCDMGNNLSLVAYFCESSHEFIVNNSRLQELGFNVRIDKQSGLGD